MATSLQRLIIMIVILDLVIGMVIIFGLSSSFSYARDNIEDRILVYNNWTDDFDSRFSSPTDDENRQLLNPTAGDARASGLSVFQLFSKGLEIKDLSTCIGEDCSNGYVYWVYTIIGVFLFVIHMLLGVEIYFMIINRKYT